MDDPDKVKKKKKSHLQNNYFQNWNLHGSKPVGFGVVGRLCTYLCIFVPCSALKALGTPLSF